MSGLLGSWHRPPTSTDRLLVDLYRTAASAADEQEVFDLAVRGIAETLGDAAAILVLDEDRQWLRVVAWHAVDPGVARAIRDRGDGPVTADAGLAARVLRDGPVLLAADGPAEDAEAEAGTPRTSFLGHLGVRSLLAVPVKAAGVAFGVLEVARTADELGPFMAADLGLVDELVADGAVLAAVRARRDHAAADARLHQEVRRAETVGSFFAEVAPARSRQRVYDALAEHAERALVGEVMVYARTPDGEHLELVAARPDNGAVVAIARTGPGRRIRVGEATVGRVAATGQPFYRSGPGDPAADVEAVSMPRELAEVVGDRLPRSSMASPVHVGGEVDSVIYIARPSDDPRPFDAADFGFVQALATRAAVALEAVDAHRRADLGAERERIRAEVLEATTLSDDDEDAMLAAMVGRLAELGGFALIEQLTEDGTHVVLRATAVVDPALRPIADTLATGPLIASAGIMGEVLRTGEPVFLPRVEGPPSFLHPEHRPLASEWMRGLIAAPLRVAGQIAGAVAVVHVDAAFRGFEPEDLELLTGIASAGTIILEHAAARRARDAAAVEQRRAAATLRAILDATPLPSYLLDADGRIVLWTPAAEGVFGYTADEVLGHEPPMLPVDRHGARRDPAGRLVGGQSLTGVQVRRWRKDGTELEMLLYAAAVPGAADDDVRFLAIHADVTSRNRLVRESRQTAATLRAILDSSPLAILAVGLDNRVIFWSRGAERLYGYSRQEALGRVPPHFPGNAEDYLPEEWARLRGGEERLRLETQRRHRDGHLVDVVIHAVALRDAAGEITGIMTVQDDVTEQRRLETQLAQAQKMETIGQLAGGVAHDFNNILTAIIGFAELTEQATNEPETADALRSIRTSAQRAAALTHQLLAFSRRQLLRPEIVDANEVVRGLEGLLRRLIGEHVELQVATRADVGTVLVDRTQLEQVILNLAVNARDAMPDGGRLVIRTDVAVFTEQSPHLALTPGEYVELSVADTGVGMDEATRARVFEPFFTTKDVGKGTGLGLSTVYGIVRQSGGEVWVYSEPGLGTTFRIYFPRAAGPAIDPGEPDHHPERRADGTVLLVEDEPLLRELAATILAREGFRVHQAATPAEAMHVAESLPRLDVLVSDVIMPGMTGVELARRLRAEWPDVPVVLMSGYAEDATDAASIADAYVSKPFTPAILAGATRRVVRPYAGPERRRVGHPDTEPRAADTATQPAGHPR